MRKLGRRPDATDRQCLNKSVREIVHEHRNVATMAIKESRMSQKVAERSLRVSEEAMRVLEESRRRDEGMRDAG